MVHDEEDRRWGVKRASTHSLQHFLASSTAYPAISFFFFSLDRYKQFNPARFNIHLPQPAQHRIRATHDKPSIDTDVRHLPSVPDITLNPSRPEALLLTGGNRAPRLYQSDLNLSSGATRLTDGRTSEDLTGECRAHLKPRSVSSSGVIVGITPLP